jgi:hypothetical protein
MLFTTLAIPVSVSPRLNSPTQSLLINKNCWRAWGKRPLRVCSTVLANRNTRKYGHFVVLTSFDASFSCFFGFVTCKYILIDYVDTLRYCDVSFSVLRDRFRSHNNKRRSCVDVIVLVVRYAKRNMDIFIKLVLF